MKLSRMDLDGTGSPAGLITCILKAVPDMPIPVPLEELCAALDIAKIAQLETQGFDGALITDECKREGVILIARDQPRPRQRFSIAHELGHFVIPTHMPRSEDRFLCSSEDMLCMEASERDRRASMEIQANQFGALLLMPPPALRREIGKARQPDLRHIIDLAAMFDVSKDAMARAYAEYHPQPVAIVVARHGRVKRIYRNKNKFPFVAIRLGELLPRPLASELAPRPRGRSQRWRKAIPKPGWIGQPPTA